jgi:hypothetical protein
MIAIALKTHIKDSVWICIRIIAVRALALIAIPEDILEAKSEKLAQPETQ